jgi:hypothetical protein
VFDQPQAEAVEGDAEGAAKAAPEAPAPSLS